MTSTTSLMKKLFSVVLVIAVSFGAGCRESHKQEQDGKNPPRHEHKPPHGGTAVELGNEEYHIELVLDAASGKLQAYVMDGELENFVRIAPPSFEIAARLGDQTETLVFNAVANSATCETIGDTALFEVQAGWLKTAKNFDAILKQLNVKGKNYENVAFNFPKGNDSDDKK